MSKNNYEKTQWVNGVTVISAEKLNNIENELEKSCTMHNSLQERMSVLGSNIQTIIEHIKNSDSNETPPVAKKKLVVDLYEGASDRFYTMDFDYKGVLYKKTNSSSTIGNIVENKEDFLMKKATAQLATEQTTFISPKFRFGADQYVQMLDSKYTAGTRAEMTNYIKLQVKNSNHDVVENIHIDTMSLTELNPILNHFGNDKTGYIWTKDFLGMLDDLAIFNMAAINNRQEQIFPIVSSGAIVPNSSSSLGFLLFYDIKKKKVVHVTDITSVEELTHPFLNTAGLIRYYSISNFFKDGSTFILHDSKRYKALKNNPKSMEEVIPENATNFKIMGVDVTTGYAFENNLTTPAFARYTLKEM